MHLLLLTPALFVALSFVSLIASSFGDVGDFTVSGLGLKENVANPVCDVCRFSEPKFIVATITNNRNVDQPYVSIVEARDADGITVSLHLSVGTLSSKTSTQTGASWDPANAGNYEVRAFVINSFVDPEILSSVSETNVTISND